MTLENFRGITSGHADHLSRLMDELRDMAKDISANDAGRLVSTTDVITEKLGQALETLEELQDMLDEETCRADSYMERGYTTVEGDGVIMKNMELLKIWEKGGYRRAYLDIDVLQKAANLELATYKSGNIKSAKLDGEKISNSCAARIMARFSNSYFDMNKGEWSFESDGQQEEDWEMETVKENIIKFFG